MPSPIATLSIDKSAIAADVLSYEGLSKTRNDEKGPLRQFMEWIGTQIGGRNRIDQARLKIGRDGDPWSMLYYHNGTRYKVLRNGRALVSSADAEDMMEPEERDLQCVMDAVLADAVWRRLRASCAGAGCKLGQARLAGGADAGRDNGSVPEAVYVMGIVADGE